MRHFRTLLSVTKTTSLQHCNVISTRYILVRKSLHGRATMVLFDFLLKAWRMYPGPADPSVHPLPRLIHFHCQQIPDDLLLGILHRGPGVLPLDTMGMTELPSRVSASLRLSDISRTLNLNDRCHQSPNFWSACRLTALRLLLSA